MTEPPSIAAGPRRPGWYRRWGKRAFDLALTLAACVVALPVAALLALLVRRKLGRPVLFRQQRPGLGGRPFTLYKFRTMSEARDALGRLLRDGDRLTGLGRVLRAMSLDELPTLWNVLAGDMSLVGPRPLLARYYEWFTPAERERFSVRPGITGLAQVSGRNDLSWDERIAADLRYVQECSLGLDLRILLLTMAGVLTRRGLRVDPGATMLDFDEERRRRAPGGPIR